MPHLYIKERKRMVITLDMHSSWRVGVREYSETSIKHNQDFQKAFAACVEEGKAHCVNSDCEVVSVEHADNYLRYEQCKSSEDP